MKHMSLTFRELQLIKSILGGNLALRNFTPEMYYDAVGTNAAFSYAGLYMLLRYINTINRDLNTDYNLEHELQELENSIDATCNFLCSGSATEKRFQRMNNNDSDEITVSKRFHQMNIATSGVASYAKTSFTCVMRSTKSFFLKCLANSRIPNSVYPELSKEYEKDKANTIKEYEKDKADAIKRYDVFLRDKKREIVSDIVKYDNFFNTIMTYHDGGMTYTSPSWIPNFGTGLGGNSMPNGFIKTRNDDDTFSWKAIAPLNDSSRNRYWSKNPFEHFFLDAFAANTSSRVVQMPLAVFHNNEFTHFTKAWPDKTDSAFVSDTWNAPELVRNLESRGFKVKTKKTKMSVGNDANRHDVVKTEYDVSDLILTAWKASDKDYKIETIKKTSGTWISSIMNSIENLRYAQGRNMSKMDIQRAASTAITTSAVNSYDYCRLLRTLYVYESDLEVKANIETAILAVREVFKTEIYKHANEIKNIVRDMPNANVNIQKFLSVAKEMLNDDAFPQGMLKDAEKIDEVKRNTHSYKGRIIAAHPNLSFQEKMVVVRRRLNEMKAEQVQYSKGSYFTRKSRAAKVQLLEQQKNDFVKENDLMINQIYALEPGQNGVYELRARTNQNSLPVLLGKTHESETNDNQGRSDEYYRRLQPGEGIHNDADSDAFDYNVQHAHAISKKKTGKNLAAEQQRRLYSDAISEQEATRIDAENAVWMANRARLRAAQNQQINAQHAVNQQDQPVVNQDPQQLSAPVIPQPVRDSDADLQSEQHS